MNAKTQLIWLGTTQQLDKLSVTELSLLSARMNFSSTVHDLGFILDSQLTMKDHVSAMQSRCASRHHSANAVPNDGALKAVPVDMHQARSRT